MPRPCRPEEVGKQNVLQPSRQPPDPTSELLESIQSVLRQQELQIQELLAEQTERVAGVVCSMLHQSDESAPQVLEPAAVEAKVAPTFSTSSVQESIVTDDTSQRKGTKSKGMMSHLNSMPEDVQEQDMSLAKRLNGYMKTCCGSAGEAFAAVLILSNAILFGVQADHAVQQPSHEVPEFFRIAGLTFTVLFTLELLLRLRTEGRGMFSCHNPDIKWNVMDTVLVMLGILDEVMTRTFAAMRDAPDPPPNMSSARILRLLRLVRVARVLRVLRFFSDLRVMIMGVLSSLKALMWALILLFFIIYITAVCILQFVGEYLADNPQDFPSGPLEFVGLSPFSSLLTTCFTLFLTISGGISWGELAPPLMLVNPVVTPILTLYIALATFCVLNIVTGVFVDRSAAMALQDEENMMLEEIQNRNRWIKEIETLFAKADTDQSGNVEWEEFENALADLRVQLCFKNLGIDLHKVSLEQIWQLIDFDNKGYIEISEFADCLLEMHGVAHSIDIARLRHEQQRTARKLEHVLRLCDTGFQTLSEMSRSLVVSGMKPIKGRKSEG